MISAEDRIRNYLTTLSIALKGMPLSDRNEIVSEIAVHLRESIQQPGTDIESVISHLGPARELAAQYRDSLLIQRTAQTISPWLLMRAVLRLARISAIGFAVFLLGLAGYGAGGGLILTALLKPFLPKQVGLWVGPGIFNFGVHEAGGNDGGVGFLLMTGAPVHEVLGWWYIPVTLALGTLFIWGTTRLLRKLVRGIKNQAAWAVHSNRLCGRRLFVMRAAGIYWHPPRLCFHVHHPDENFL